MNTNNRVAALVGLEFLMRVIPKEELWNAIKTYFELEVEQMLAEKIARGELMDKVGAVLWVRENCSAQEIFGSH